ncbi:immunoglobulin-like domain-containing protein [Enterococcus villorum]|uniref:immunoglobulin-like domain-containing protein n=4 Tax=Enterococcus villorum TaxID=112904 RepID=UPI0035EA0A6A
MSKKKLTNKRKKQLLAMFMSAGIMTNSFVGTGLALDDEVTTDSANTSGVSSDNTNINDNPQLTTNSSGSRILSTKISEDYYYGESKTLKGTCEPFFQVTAFKGEHSAAVNISSTVKADILGNFELFINESKIRPGDVIRVRSIDATGLFGSDDTTYVHYSAPKVNNSYSYDSPITGTAYPGAEVYISDTPNFTSGWVTSTADASGNFTLSANQLKSLSGYASGKTMYLRSSAAGSNNAGELLSHTVSTQITENKATITANNFTLDYGSAYNSNIAIQKSGVKATDANGNDVTNNVQVSGNVNTKIPGNYNVTFTSPESGKSVTVVATVKDAPADNATITAHNATVEYGSTWNDSVAKQVTGVKATDKYGNDVTNNVKVSGTVDTKKPGNYNVTFTSPESGKSITVVITVKDVPADNATITAHDATVEYGSTWNDSVAKQVTGVKATDKYGNDVTNNVTVSGTVDTKKPGDYNVTFTSPESGKSITVVITVKSAKYEKPVLESPYIYQTDLKGKTTPNTDVLISDYEDFSGFTFTHSDASGNFTIASSSINALAKHTPGITLYVKAGDIENANYSEVETTIIHYPTPKVDETYAYDTEIKGTAYPNSRVFISDSDFGGYVTVEVDASGNFTAPVSLLKALTDYESGNTLYFKSSESDIYSQAVSLTSSTKITENQSSITANDFTLEYGADFNDQIAIEKAGATATDANGNEEGVKVKESNVDTSKPGEYSVTFISDSGKEKTVKVTVKESVKAEKPEFETPYIYGDTLNGKTSPNADVAVRVGDLSPIDFTIQANDKGEFSIPAEKLKQYDDYKVGNDIYATASFETAGSVSDVGFVTVEENQSSIEAHDFEVDYGFNLTDEAAIEKAGAKATDKYGKEESVSVKENNVDTNKPGEYQVTFVSDSGKEKTVKVTVKNKPIIGSEPIIHASDMTYQVGETLNPLLDITAEDPEDGDLTDQVKADASGVNMSKAGDYDLKLSVTDKDGNTTEQTVTVHVIDQVTDGPVINGADDVRIDERSKFDPLDGVTAQDSEGNDLTSNLTYTGSVDTSTPGEYTIKYYVYDKNGKVATAKRKVTVQSDESKPVVMSPDKLTIKQNSKFDPTLYAQAYDNEDGNITDQITVIGQIYTDKIGAQYITYKVTDSDGNEASKMMEVDVVETLGNAPVITGADDIELNIGDEFDPLSGVTAHDEEDGDLTSEIKYGGVVNTGKAGEYTVTYTVWDSDFNVETVERTVKVKEKVVAPTIESEKEIHVAYGSEWNDELAKEQAKVKATDGQGNDVTKDVVVTSNPVDTTKPGSYTVEFSITEDGLTSTSQTTVVVDEAIAPTIKSEKEIHVTYGSEWDDELAKEQAKVKATDGQGNDVTKDVVVTSNPVDTTKPGSYTVEFSITEDGLTSTSQTIVIVDEQEKEYLLEPNEYVIGKDAYVTGKAGEDVKFVALYKEENGKRVFYKRAPVADGQIKVYASGLITDKDQIIYAVAEDENHQTITVDGKNVEKQVKLSVLGEDTNYQLSPDEYILGTQYITGIYDNDQADHLSLRVDGKIVNTIYPDQSSNEFKMYANSVTSTDQKVDVLEYNGDELLVTKTVTIKAPEEVTYNLSANDYTIGDTYVTGEYDNQYADTVKLIVDDKVVKLSHPDLSQNSYKIIANSFIDSMAHEVYIAEYKGSQELSRVKVNLNEPKVYEIDPDIYHLGEASITGKWNSNDDSVKYVSLYVNDQRVSINALNEDGTFNINTKNTIKAPTDKVELQLADANKLAVGDKVPVTVQKNDYKLKIDDYTLGDAKVTGTFDSRYTTDKDQIQLVIDGTVTKQVVYKATDTNPGKENEAFTIVVKGLITDKNQKVVVRHMKDGEVVVEKDLTIK